MQVHIGTSLVLLGHVGGPLHRFAHGGTGILEEQWSVLCKPIVSQHGSRTPLDLHYFWFPTIGHIADVQHLWTNLFHFPVCLCKHDFKYFKSIPRQVFFPFQISRAVYSGQFVRPHYWTVCGEKCQRWHKKCLWGKRQGCNKRQVLMVHWSCCFTLIPDYC